MWTKILDFQILRTFYLTYKTNDFQCKNDYIKRLQETLGNQLRYLHHAAYDQGQQLGTLYSFLQCSQRTLRSFYFGLRAEKSIF